MDRQGKTAPPALKICGVTRAVDAAHCLALGVDYVGFNLYRGSRRYITPAAAAKVWQEGLGREPSATTQPVLVLVDPTDAEVCEAIAAFPAARVLQFHGTETPADLSRMRSHFGGRAVWKALGIAEAAGLDAAALFRGVTDLVLFDAAPTSQDRGGTGKTFEWEWLKGSPQRALPFGVAGGIRPGMLKDIMPLAPTLIDVCSGVESAPGIKDVAAVTALWTELQDLQGEAT